MINEPWVLHDVAYDYTHACVHNKDKSVTDLLQSWHMYYDIFNQTYVRTYACLITESYKFNMLNIHGSIQEFVTISPKFLAHAVYYYVYDIINHAYSSVCGGND